MCDEEYHVHLILEGLEEQKFFEIVLEKGIGPNLKLTYKNANGAAKIPALFQDAISDEEYDIVLCIYDVDYKFSCKDSAYSKVFKDLIEVTGSEARASSVSFCSNPNILIWYLVGADAIDNIPYIYSSKSKNTLVLNKYWNEIGRGIDKNKNYKPYEAREYQLNLMRDSYLFDRYSYETLLENGKKINNNLLLNEKSSNLYPLLEALHSGNINFFENIKKEKETKK